jgi:hypothetical protein
LICGCELQDRTAAAAAADHQRVRKSLRISIAAFLAITLSHGSVLLCDPQNAEGVRPESGNASAHDVERLMQLLMESLGEGFGGATEARRPADDSAGTRNAL